MRSKREIDSIVGIFFISRCFLNGWQNKEECTELIINQVLIFFFPQRGCRVFSPRVSRESSS